MPMPPSMTRTSTFTAALALLTHLLSDIGRTPMSTMTQMRTMTMISAQVLAHAAPEGRRERAGEHDEHRRRPVGDVHPVQPGGEGTPALPVGLAYPDVDAALLRPAAAQLGGHQAVGDEEDHGEDARTR